MTRFAVRLLLAFFTVLLFIVGWHSSREHDWPNKLPRPGFVTSEPAAAPPQAQPPAHSKQGQWSESDSESPKTDGQIEQDEKKPAGTIPEGKQPDGTKLLGGETQGKTKWSKVPIRHPVKDQQQLPTDPPLDLPRVQFNFPPEGSEGVKARQLRLNTVRNAFRHDWGGYRSFAWMKDEIKPLSGGYSDNFGGWAATLVDSLDTLWIMSLHDEFDEAVKAATTIDFSQAKIDTINVFETTIRYMGGFLSAYDLSGRDELLEKAIELGEMLYVAFDTPTRMPIARWEWKTALDGKEQSQTQTLLAELGSLTLEFTRLSQITGDSKYFDAVQRITDMLKDQQDKTKLPGLWPLICDASKLDCSQHNEFSLGAMADSTYEYLPKEYMLLGGHGADYRNMYAKAIAAAKKHLFFRPNLPNDPDVLMSGIRRVDDPTNSELIPEGQHLACFLGGMVGIASRIFEQPADIDVARKLTEGCVWAYDATKRGIMPEVFRVLPCASDDCSYDDYAWHQEAIAYWRASTAAHDVDIGDLKLPKGMTAVPDRRYQLRPEAIESVFIMYRLTGDPAWMDRGWKMFKKIEQFTHTEIGHASLMDVTLDETATDGTVYDKMESFWTAETLKYFYLLFCDPKYISLDEYVFNTEAHPFKRPVAPDK